jgi:N6-L-threonylcarbamoyladenine synthase
MVIIRKLKAQDIDTVNKFIEDQDNILKYKELEENPFLKLYVILDNYDIIGFINYSIMYDRMELNYICIIPEYRNKGIATKLINHMIKDGLSKSCKNITLEVRENNFIAINLYSKLGFKVVAIRENYYKQVNGLLMLKELGD